MAMQFEQEWKESYLIPVSEAGDAHALFASKIGKTRNEAKEICWFNLEQPEVPNIVARLISCLCEELVL